MFSQLKLKKKKNFEKKILKYIVKDLNSSANLLNEKNSLNQTHIFIGL